MSAPEHDTRCEGLPEYSADELRVMKLAALDVGDIVGARLMDRRDCLPFLIVAADGKTMRTRCMTSQFPLIFERHDGMATENNDGQMREWRISCIQPLPLEMHNLMLSVDRRIRLGSDGTTNRLDEGDKRVLVFIADFWDRYPI